MIRGLLLLVAAAVAMLVGIAGFAFILERRQAWEAAPRIVTDVAKLPEMDVALVLGTGPFTHWRDGRVTTNIPFAYRLDAAAELWRAGKVSILILSGAPGEPAAMRSGLLARGVFDSALRLDDGGLRTLDSVRRAQSAFGQARLIVVSQRFHLVRALFLARANGLEAWGLEARDVDRAYSIFTELRRYPSALRAYWDVWLERLPLRVNR